MIEIKEEFRVRLEKALSYCNMKPVDLAKATGISEATISQYRSGYSKPKDTRLVSIANALQVDPTWLMGIDVPMKKNATIISGDLSPDEMSLLADYKQLNDTGKSKVREYAKDLTDKYSSSSKISSISGDTPILRAAHLRTDVEITEEGLAHDQAIMQDDDF